MERHAAAVPAPVRLAAGALIAALLLPLAGHGSRDIFRPLLPDHVRAQVGGGQGFISAGFGYAFLDGRLQAEALYGFAPESVVGTDIHALSQKTTLAPAVLRLSPNLRLAPVLAGYSANVAIGEDYFLFLPEHFQGYYWPSALRFWLFGGMRAEAIRTRPGAVRGVAAVVEVGAQDVYWQSWLRNATVKAADILSLSLAIQVRFQGK